MAIAFVLKKVVYTTLRIVTTRQLMLLLLVLEYTKGDRHLQN